MSHSKPTLLGAFVALGGASGCAVSTDPGGGLEIGLTIGFGAVVLANILYAKMRLEDEPSAAKRFVSFLVGLPTTFLIFLLVEPSDSWIHRRLARDSNTDPDRDPVEIRREFEQELTRMRRAELAEQSGSPSPPSGGPPPSD